MLGIEDFEFLAWMRLTCFFRDDLMRQLIALGMDAGEAWVLARCEAVVRSDIVQFYMDYGRHEPEFFGKLLADCHARYTKACAAASAGRKSLQHSP